MFGAGGQKRVSDDFIRTFPHPLPGLSEQRTIASFLDRETKRIDAFVAKKEQLIELLQEKRTALIARVVTQGIHCLLTHAPQHLTCFQLFRRTGHCGRCDALFDR